MSRSVVPDGMLVTWALTSSRFVSHVGIANGVFPATGFETMFQPTTAAPPLASASTLPSLLWMHLAENVRLDVWLKFVVVVSVHPLASFAELAPGGAAGVVTRPVPTVVGVV